MRSDNTVNFVANDLAAMGALTAIRQAGLSVPDDIALVGYHNSYLARFSSISPTSIDQPRHEMGILAARFLLERIESERPEPQREVLKLELVPRSTSAPPR